MTSPEPTLTRMLPGGRPPDGGPITERRNSGTARLASALVIGLFIAGLCWVFIELSTVPPTDLGVYRAAGWAVLHRVDPYGPGLPADLPFTYPPISAWLFTPLAPLSGSWLVRIWMFGSLALLAWAVDRVLPDAALPAGTVRRTAVLAGSLFVATLTVPISDHLGFGQINIALMAVTMLDVLGPRGRRPSWLPVGVGVGLAAAMKLTPAIFIVYLLLTSRVRAAVVATGTAIGLTAAAAALSPHPSREFFLDLLWHLDSRVGVGDNTAIGNQSLLGALLRVLPAHLASHVWAAGALLLGVGGLWLARRTWARRGDLAGLAATGLVAVMISPVSWTHYLVWLIPLSAGLLISTRRADRIVSLITVGLLLSRAHRLGALWIQRTAFWLYHALGAVLQDSYLILAIALVGWLGLSAPPPKRSPGTLPELLPEPSPGDPAISATG